MLTMVVTLEVSQLSGWLNLVALCRVEKRACDAGRGAGREVGGREAVAAQAGMHGGRPEPHVVRVRARAERTLNMSFMSVTLEVSKLSGLLKAYAYCRVEKRGMRCGARCGPGGGRA
jgi:hypothetical protein